MQLWQKMANEWATMKELINQYIKHWANAWNKKIIYLINDIYKNKH